MAVGADAGVRALRYYGGKSAHGAKGRWIAGHLPHARGYIEPFAGMLGVMLQREPSKFELANDLDRSIITWWEAVRDHTADFEHLVECTPQSRDAYDWAVQNVHHADLLQRALAVHVVLSQGFVPGMSSGLRSWRRWRRLASMDIRALADRLADVLLENRDAVEVLDEQARYPNHVVYCDPPYHTADTLAYTVDVDRGAMAEVLRAAKAKVAISGYNDEWDELGWERRDYFTYTTNTAAGSGPRTEVLWCNYAAPEQPTLF